MVSTVKQKVLLLILFFACLSISAFSQGPETAKPLWEIKGPDIASATTLVIPGPGNNAGNYFDVTGVTTITAINKTRGPIGQEVVLHFDGAVTLTHHATNLILPNSANYTTAAGDEFTFREYAEDDWRCTSYVLASGEAIVGGTGGFSVTNEANNRVITSTGAGTGNAEANLTFDGSVLETQGLVLDGSTTNQEEVRSSTSDGSDTGMVLVNGGGNSGSGRGAQVSVHGNENTFGGRLTLAPGNVATGDLRLALTHASGEIQFINNTSGIEAFMNNSGTWDFNANTLTDIGQINLNTRMDVNSPSSTAATINIKGSGANIIDMERISIQPIFRLAISGTGNFSIFDVTNVADRFIVNSTGTVSIPNLSGTGTRLVTANASGDVDAATIAITTIDIGDWNMDLTAVVSVNHGLDIADIKSVTVMINQDTGPRQYPIDFDPGGASRGHFFVSSTSIVMERITGNGFDNASYDATSFNRGQITIIHVP